jgi:hypothetical protein
VLEQFSGCTTAGNLLECGARVLKIREHKFFGQRAASRKGGIPRSSQRVVSPLHERDVADVRDFRSIAMDVNVESGQDRAP